MNDIWHLSLDVGVLGDDFSQSEYIFQLTYCDKLLVFCRYIVKCVSNYSYDGPSVSQELMLFDSV